MLCVFLHDCSRYARTGSLSLVIHRHLHPSCIPRPAHGRDGFGCDGCDVMGIGIVMRMGMGKGKGKGEGGWGMGDDGPPPTSRWSSSFTYSTRTVSECGMLLTPCSLRVRIWSISSTLGYCSIVAPVLKLCLRMSNFPLNPQFR